MHVMTPLKRLRSGQLGSGVDWQLLKHNDPEINMSFVTLNMWTGPFLSSNLTDVKYKIASN